MCCFCGPDEKALIFRSTFPQECRLYWAIHSIGISLSLAPIAVAFFRDASPLLGQSRDLLNTNCYTFYLWVVSPTAVTWGSFRLSSDPQTICEFIEAGEHADVDMSTSSLALSSVLVGLMAMLNDAHKRLR